ncbi:hypothetical protein BpHYR1_012553 [Brachionus plicatilis]|uniref:Uncharacterized protein n=1 Tax=Brachionus plicatilis TaxID=10195 RepID=A0A3M7PK33_BRAPC|nr:hypothetical protein BpHYR1_012553 [Brachionus plicatilis]
MALTPAVVGMPSMSMLSLIMTGTQCNSPMKFILKKKSDLERSKRSIYFNEELVDRAQLVVQHNRTREYEFFFVNMASF